MAAEVTSVELAMKLVHSRMKLVHSRMRLVHSRMRLVHWSDVARCALCEQHTSRIDGLMHHRFALHNQ